MKIYISDETMRKLIEKHGVVEREVHECFQNRDGPMFQDLMEDHQTDPPTMWFVAETDRGRLLAVYCVPMVQGGVRVKTAFPPGPGRAKKYEDLKAAY